MSHMYFVCDPALTTLDEVRSCTPIKDVVFSNISHHEIQKALGFNERKFVNRDDPTDEMFTLYHTTIHDTEPVYIYAYELEAMLDEHYDERPDLASQYDLLYDLCAAVREREYEQQRVYVF